MIIDIAILIAAIVFAIGIGYDIRKQITLSKNSFVIRIFVPDSQDLDKVWESVEELLRPEYPPYDKK